MYVAVMGYGTVGSGVVEVLTKNHDSIVKRSTQNEMEVKYILDLRDFPGDPHESKMIKDFNIILNDDDVKVVVETMGGLHPAYEFVSSCLKAGKSVVTSNKELVAAKGCELLQYAQENNVNFLFEASVGGGIPIIRSLQEALLGSSVERLSCIINGTCNYILSRMSEAGLSFEDALKEAQAKGFAEADPTFDIEGIDSAHKTALLASLCSDKHVDFEKIHVTGISQITAEDIATAADFGCTVKLLGIYHRVGDRVDARVHPCLLPKDHLLSSVNGVLNAVFLECDNLGPTLQTGAGAGRLPTASAVVADIVDSAIHNERRKLIGWTKPETDTSADADSKKFRYFIRTSDDKETVKAVFSNVTEIECLAQTDFAFITEPLSVSELNIEKSKLGGIKTAIRVLD